MHAILSDQRVAARVDRQTRRSKLRVSGRPAIAREAASPVARDRADLANRVYSAHTVIGRIREVEAATSVHGF